MIAVMTAFLLSIAASGQEQMSLTTSPNRPESETSPDHGHPSPSQELLTQLVESLADDSYHRRLASQDTILDLVTPDQRDSNANHAVVTALSGGLRHPQLEVRVASARLLRSIEQAIFDHQVDQLLNPHINPDSIEITGWKRFSEIAGHDFAARSLFARVAMRHSDVLREIDANRNGHQGQDKSSRLSQLDPYRLASDDAAGWAVVLSTDVPSVQHGIVNRSARIAITLSNSALGPRVNSQRDTVVIQRLVSHWVGTHGGSESVRERLLIAMRYACYARANELCNQVFLDDGALPSCQATAMLCASALRRPDLESLLIDRIHDDRTAHVWQLIASRHTRIRTQVRDVALALLLHQHNMDPRQVGFDELQADPLTIFRDHSLGFADEQTRCSAHQRAGELLNDVGVILAP